MASDPHSAYKSTQIETASREQILLMLYDGAIKFMEQARDAMEEGNHERSHRKLIRAQDIVTELMASLDMDLGGEVAEDLYDLYDYVLHNLVQANVEKDADRLQEVIPVMQQLHETWDEIINQQGMTVQKARQQQNGADPPGDSPEEAETATDPDDGTTDTDPDSPSSSMGDATYGNLSFQG